MACSRRPSLPTRDRRPRVEDILASIEKIERYVEGMSREEFRADEKTVDAVVRNFGIIGEAARHIPESIRDRYPHVPWDEMRGMRNVVIHEYAIVSAAVIWQAVKGDLPPLKPALRTILEEV